METVRSITIKTTAKRLNASPIIVERLLRFYEPETLIRIIRQLEHDYAASGIQRGNSDTAMWWTPGGVMYGPDVVDDPLSAQ